MKLKVYLLFLLSALFFMSCNMESGAVPFRVFPPLDLSAEVWTMTNSTLTQNVICLNFYGNNDNQTYFSGFAAYAADSLDDLTNEDSVSVTNTDFSAHSYRMLPNPSGFSNTLTLSGLTEPDDPTYYTVFISNDSSNFISNNAVQRAPMDLVNGQVYFVFVKAYGSDVVVGLNNQTNFYQVYSFPTTAVTVTFDTAYQTDRVTNF